MGVGVHHQVMICDLDFSLSGVHCQVMICNPDFSWGEGWARGGGTSG